MKTIFVGFIAILMAMFVLGGTVSAAITALPGDYNVDGRVTESDLTAYKQDMDWYSGCMLLTENNTVDEPVLSEHVGVVYPDMNGDGYLTLTDIRILEEVYRLERTGVSVAVPHTYVVGDVDGDGVFDMDDLKILMDGDGIYGNYWNNVLPNYLSHGWLVFRQIPRTV